MSDETASEPDIMEPTLWRRNGWTARVIKNEDDDGWAVEIRKAGLAEPALISPWVMGRDKKNPKPFDGPAFTTFVKTASEVLARSARQREQALKKRLDPRRYNGASMVGLAGVVIKSHGGADATAFAHAVRVGVLEAQNGVPAQISAQLQAQAA